jgi:averantin hydroxylase
VIYNLCFHPLRAYPGPKAWAATVWSFVLSQLSGNLAADILELHEKYGPVVRIAPNELSFVDPAACREILAHRQGHDEFGKSYFSAIKPPNGVFGILMANREEHGRLRRLLSHSFSDKGMREQQSHIIYNTDLLVRGLREESDNGPQDLVQWLNWTTFDIIGTLAFGQSFECLETKTMHPWIKSVFGNVKVASLIGSLKRLRIEWILPYLASKKTIRHRMQNSQYSADKIHQRLEKGSAQGDFWDNVVKHLDKSGGITLQEMETTAANIVLGGSETNSTLLSGCIYLCLRHPEVMKKLVWEIRTAFASSDDMDLFSTAKLKYTLAVLDETMRIYAPVPVQSSREVPIGGDLVAGKFLPAGTIVHCPQYAAGRVGYNFSRPTEFHPERFLGDPQFEKDNFAALLPFSLGPRNCIGRNLAYAEMRLILAKVLYNFDLELDDRVGDWMDQKVFVLWEKHPLWVKVTPVKVP